MPAPNLILTCGARRTQGFGLTGYTAVSRLGKLDPFAQLMVSKFFFRLAIKSIRRSFIDAKGPEGFVLVSKRSF